MSILNLCMSSYIKEILFNVKNNYMLDNRIPNKLWGKSSFLPYWNGRCFFFGSVLWISVSEVLQSWQVLQDSPISTVLLFSLNSDSPSTAAEVKGRWFLFHNNNSFIIIIIIINSFYLLSTIHSKQNTTSLLDCVVARGKLLGMIQKVWRLPVVILDAPSV